MWHPIGTAPRDRPFLTWVEDERESNMYRAIFNRECSPEGRFIIARKKKGDPSKQVRELVNGRIWTATQWFELPNQPIKQEKTNAE